MTRTFFLAVAAAVALGSAISAEASELHAGAAARAIDPVELPVRQNGGFLEAEVDRVRDPLFARALAFEQGKQALALCIVDSCMLPRPLLDEAKAKVTQAIGLPQDRILIAATHTHTAPSAMDFCLGSRADPAYVKLLPGRIAEAITAAWRRREPAELGSTVIDASAFTHCRRWIRRLDSTLRDPFGELTVHANMHPGHENADCVGPSGPVDTGLTIVAVRAKKDGRPLCLVGNFSMHYYGVGGGLSPDYCGLFARRVAARLAPEDDQFVAMLSQGTSGDLHWMDYARPRDARGIEKYSEGLVELALGAAGRIRYEAEPLLAMAERRLVLARRRPDAARLAWARGLLPEAEAVEGPSPRRPRNQPEVYAEQAFFIARRPEEEIVLQAIRLGSLGLTAIPCEVYGLTGLELKARSPLQPTMNLELANGAAGYIPPPEQHALGGYTTWPARTAGLEVEAEPKIVEALLTLLEEVAGRERREPERLDGNYARAVRGDRPSHYFRFDEFRGPTLSSVVGDHRARAHGRLAFHLAGPASAAFSLHRPNRALQLVGGAVELPADALDADRTLELWFWNGRAAREADEELGTVVAQGRPLLRLLGAEGPNARLALGSARGARRLAPKSWHHLALVREGERYELYLDGRRELTGAFSQLTTGASVTVGVLPGSDAVPFEGKIDELALYERALRPVEIDAHFRVAAVEAEAADAPRAAAGSKRRPPQAAERLAVLRSAKPRALWSLREGKDPLALAASFEEGAARARENSDEPNFLGGRLRAVVPELGDDYSVVQWIRNDVAPRERPVAGYFFSRGADGAAGAPGEHLGIGGTHSHLGRLIVFNGNARDELLGGATPLGTGLWNHVALVREGKRLRVHLNGRRAPELEGELVATYPREGPSEIFVGGRSDRFAPFRGRLEDVALFDRALSAEEIEAIYRASGLEPTPTAREERDPPALLSEPLSPADGLAAIRLRRGFRIELVASEPLLRDPVAIDWDARGRLWVCEMADYPLGGTGPSGGRVRVLEDDDGDGRYDRSTLFAEGLSFPKGVLAWRKGCLVTAAPEILYLEDLDGDLRVDRKHVLYSGFLPGNQQLRVNGLRYGLDGWIHCAAGGHHPGHGSKTRIRSHRTGEVLALGSRDLRIHPETGALDALAGPSQFGRPRDDFGRWFGVQNSRPLWHYALPDRYTRRQGDLPLGDGKVQLRGVNPELRPSKTPQPRFHSFEHRTRFTSACGPSLYRDELLFPRDGTTQAFTCDPFHSLVQRAVLREEGASFRATVDHPEGELDFLTSSDRWCRPVQTRAGPDGALWVVDMYRYLIEHPDWLPKEVREELGPFFRHGDDRGRIYRVLGEGQRPRPIEDFAEESSPELVERLGHPSGVVRDLAQRILTERRQAELTPILEGLAREGSPLARLHAIATLAASSQLSPAFLLDRLESETDAHLLARLVRLSEAEGDDPAIVEAVARLARRDDAFLRKQIAFTLGEWKSPRAGQALAALAERSGGDELLIAAISSSATAHQGALLRGLVERDALGHFAKPLLELATRSKLLEREPELAPALAELRRMLEPSREATGQAPLLASGPAKARRAASDADERREALAAYRPALGLTGRVEEGRRLFEERCSNCHALDGVGQAVGPDLRALNDRSPVALLEAILDPNAAVEPRYLGFTLRLARGPATSRILEGMISGESGTTVILRTREGQEHRVLRADIEEITPSERSFMPEGLETGLSLGELASLLRYLRQ